MLITDQLLHIELHKTGSTHTRRILSEIFPECLIVRKHNTFDSVPNQKLGDFEAKLKIGNVRNPWDWYVSLWAFGCQGAGGLFKRLTLHSPMFLFSKQRLLDYLSIGLKGEVPHLDIRQWKKLYSDVENLDNFKTWLNIILTSRFHSIGERYKVSHLSSFTGLLTYRYVRLFTYRKALDGVRSVDDLIDYDKEENFMSLVLRNESLHDDILSNASLLNRSPQKINEVLGKYSKRTLISKRERNYRNYYDDESRLLVEEFESFIIRKYGYEF